MFIAELTNLKEVEERVKQQHADLLLREKVLVRRLGAKEQEMQEYAVSKDGSFVLWIIILSLSLLQK